MSHLGSGCPHPWDQCKCDRPAADQIVRRRDGSMVAEVSHGGHALAAADTRANGSSSEDPSC